MVTPAIVKLALEHQRAGAAADEKGFTPWLLEAASRSERFVRMLTRLIEDVIQYSEAPSDWGRLIAIAVGKPGKPRMLIESYRAIFLTAWLSKVAETLVGYFDTAAIARVYRPLLSTMFLAHGLHPGQMGSRTGLGDIIITLAAVGLIWIGKRDGKLVIQVALDMSDAFPSTRKDDALRAMEKAGATPEGLSLRAALDKKSKLTVRTGGYMSDAMDIGDGLKAGRKGCPLEFVAFSGYLLDLLQAALEEGKTRTTCVPRIDDGFVAASVDDVSIFMMGTIEGISRTWDLMDQAYTKFKLRFGIVESTKSEAVLHNVEEFLKARTLGMSDSKRASSRTALSQRIAQSMHGRKIADTTLPVYTGLRDKDGSVNNGAVRNLGVRVRAGSDPLEPQVAHLLTTHAAGFELVKPTVNALNVTKVMQSYDTQVLARWIHSVPLIFTRLSKEQKRRLVSCQAAAVKKLAYMTSSVNNMAALYESGVKPVEAMALERLAAIREQLRRITPQMVKEGHHSRVIELALEETTEALGKLHVDPPTGTKLAPMSLDFPPASPELWHLSGRVVFLLEHSSMTSTDREAIKLEPNGAAATAAKVAANARRRATLELVFPDAATLDQDGSVKRIQTPGAAEGEMQPAAGAAAAIYTSHAVEEAPTATVKAACNPGSCSFWPEYAGLGLGGMLAKRMAELHEDGLGYGGVLIKNSDSLSNLAQRAKGPAKNKTYEGAMGWKEDLELLEKGYYSLIVYAHFYSHTKGDVRGDLVDNLAKEAADDCHGAKAENCEHWWKDDARNMTRAALQELFTSEVGDSFRRHGPMHPTKWGKFANLQPEESRRLAQIRVGACPKLGGHMQSGEFDHSVICGCCKTKVGRGKIGATVLCNPVAHLFKCQSTRIAMIRLTKGFKDEELLWSKHPKEVLAFVESAAKASVAAGGSMGAGWAQAVANPPAGPAG